MKTNTKTGKFPAKIRTIAMVLSVIFGLHGMVPMAMGNPIPSALMTAEGARAADIATIQQALEMKVVQHRLEQLGFSKTEIEDRMAFASDEELHQLASQSETALAGGDAGIIVTVLVVVLLVILILRLTSAPAATSELMMA